MPQFDHPEFQRLAACLGPDVQATSQRSFDLVFDDDLPVNVSLHPNGTDVAIDVWCYDAAKLVGAPRTAVVDTLLLLNQTVRSGQPFAIGLDSRDFVVVHARQAMNQLQGLAMGAWLTWLVDQARRVRALIRTLSFESGRLTYALTASSPGEA